MIYRISGNLILNDSILLLKISCALPKVTLEGQENTTRFAILGQHGSVGVTMEPGNNGVPGQYCFTSVERRIPPGRPWVSGHLQKPRTLSRTGVPWRLQRQPHSVRFLSTCKNQAVDFLQPVPYDLLSV
jgi:hypothetical protein